MTIYGNPSYPIRVTKKDEVDSEKNVYKTALEMKIESLGYKQQWHRQYVKNLEYDHRIKQIIKLNLFTDDLEDCHVEANFNIKKENVSFINIALNRVNDDFDMLKQDLGNSNE